MLQHTFEMTLGPIMSDDLQICHVAIATPDNLVGDAFLHVVTPRTLALPISSTRISCDQPLFLHWRIESAPLPYRNVLPIHSVGYALVDSTCNLFWMITDKKYELLIHI